MDPSRIRRLLLHCCRRRRVLRLFRAGGAPIGSLAPLALQGGELIGRLDLLLAEHVEPGEPVLLLHSSTAGATLLLTRLRAVEGDRARLDLPAQLLESGGRRLGRLVPPADFPVYFEFLHPLVPGLRARKRVRELGFDGLRFDLDVGGDLLVPGTAVDSAVVLLDEESLPCRGTVRHTVELLDGSYQCGFQIVEFQGPGREVWVERVLARMNPDVEEARPRDLEEAWEVFRRSGYLEEKPVEQLLLLREPFLRTWRELLRTRASAHFWLHRPGRFAPAVGTICVSKIHGTTWLVHHMSVDRAEPAISKLLILADLAPRTVLQWLVSTHPTSHVMLFYDAHTSFNQASWTDFFARHVEQGLVSLRQLWLREYLVSSIRARPDERTWVRPPTPAETERISTHLLATDGALRCRALDLDIRGLSLAPDREAAGSAAEREVLAVGEGDQALGFALVESGPPGINIFSLYDTARAVVWDEQPERRQRLQSALLAEVRRHYRERGRHSFLQVAGEGDVEWPETPIFSAPAMQALVSLEIAPFWFQHLERIWTQGGGSQ